MSTSPVTLMVARRVADGRYQDLIAWLREGEQLATDFPGYLGSGVLAPPPNDDEFQIIFRFADESTLHTWEHSASRTAWLARGSDLFAHPSEHRVSGIDGWFGAAGHRPPRWKQAVAIWLAFFPVSLLFNFVLGPLLGDLSLLPRVFVSTLALTPLMVYFFIPLSTRLLANWLNSTPARPLPATPLDAESVIRRQAGSYHTSRNICAYRRSWLANEKTPQDRIRRQARCLQAQGLPSLV